jgi:hypothetical protein
MNSAGRKLNDDEYERLSRFLRVRRYLQVLLMISWALCLIGAAQAALCHSWWMLASDAGAVASTTASGIVGLSPRPRLELAVLLMGVACGFLVVGMILT